MLDRRDDFRVRHVRDHLPDRRDDIPGRHDGGRLPDRHHEISDRHDRSRSPDRRAVEAAGSAAERAIHRHGLPPFVRRHEGVADADDAVRFACSVLSHGTWWSLANLTKQLYGHMPELRAVLAAPGKTCAATFFESYGFEILAQPKMDVLIRSQGGGTTPSWTPRCKWAVDAMQACFELVHATRGGMITVGALTGQLYRHAAAQEHGLERFFRAPKGMGMKAWLSLVQERREAFDVFTLDSMPNEPYVRLAGQLKRRSEFIWWVSDRVGEAEGASMSIADLMREHDRVSPISFALETVGWKGSLADCFKRLPQFQVTMQYDDFVRAERPVIQLLASTS